jgi:alkylmercury lyase
MAFSGFFTQTESCSQSKSNSRPQTDHSKHQSEPNSNFVKPEKRQAMNPIELLLKWDLETNQTPFEESTLPHRFEIQTLRLLAEGKPVSAEMISSKLGMPTNIAQAVFEASHGKGEWDGEGRLIGNALTLVPTQHRFRVMQKDLYTWCAHDSILLPGLLGMTAEVESPDPLNGDLIKLVITPEGPETYSPKTAVITTFQATEPATGPKSAVCTNSHYFTSHTSAEAWSHDRPGVNIMTIEEAFTQVKQNLLDVLKPILEQLQ